MACSSVPPMTRSCTSAATTDRPSTARCARGSRRPSEQYSHLPRALALRLTCRKLAELVGQDRQLVGAAIGAFRRAAEELQRPDPDRLEGLRSRVGTVGPRSRSSWTIPATPRPISGSPRSNSGSSGAARRTAGRARRPRGRPGPARHRSDRNRSPRPRGPLRGDPDLGRGSTGRGGRQPSPGGDRPADRRPHRAVPARRAQVARRLAPGAIPGSSARRPGADAGPRRAARGAGGLASSRSTTASRRPARPGPTGSRSSTTRGS